MSSSSSTQCVTQHLVPNVCWSYYDRQQGPTPLTYFATELQCQHHTTRGW